MKIYIERKIESEQDLPKDGTKKWYIVWLKLHDVIHRVRCDDTEWWLKNVGWWLEPIEASDKGAEEIFEIMFGGLNGEKGCYHFPDLKEWVLFCMKEYAAIQVAKALDKPTDEDIEGGGSDYDN